MGLVHCSLCESKFFPQKPHIQVTPSLLASLNISGLDSVSKLRSEKLTMNCENPKCKNIFDRQPSDISSHNYCSKSCAAIMNNQIRKQMINSMNDFNLTPYLKKLKKLMLTKNNCIFCHCEIKRAKKFCSSNCFEKHVTKSNNQTIKDIQNFVENNNRLPVKREMGGCYKRARKFFGTWNKAIEIAGFKPNPVLFASHHLAKDGHNCDSIAEMLIDDFLYERGLKHERSVPYPAGSYTADFKIGDKWIEYFGLAGEHKRYDELRKIKLKLVKKYSLKLIQIFPKDLYPQNQLDIILSTV